MISGRGSPRRRSLSPPSREWYGNDEADARDGDRGRRRQQAAEDCTDTDPGRAANAGAFRSLRTTRELGARLHVTEVPLPGFIRHQHADVVGFVAVLRGQVVVGTSGMFGAVVKA